MQNKNEQTSFSKGWPCLKAGVEHSQTSHLVHEIWALPEPWTAQQKGCLGLEYNGQNCAVFATY